MWDLIVSVPDHCLSFYFSQFHSALQSLTVSFSFADSHSFIQLCRLSQFHSVLQTLTVSFSFADSHSFIQFCRLSQFHSVLQTLTVSFSFADSLPCLVFNPITVNNFASLFNCTPVGRASDSMMAREIKLFILVGLGRSFVFCLLAHWGSTVGFLLHQCSSGVVWHPRDLQVSVATRFCRVLIFASS